MIWKGDEFQDGVELEPDPEGLEKLDGPWYWNAGGLGLSGAGLQIIGGSAGKVKMGPEDICTGLPNVKPEDVHTKPLPMPKGVGTGTVEF